MKKVSLKTVKSYLNRDEMRMVSGGHGGVAGCVYCESRTQCGTGSCLYDAHCQGDTCSNGLTMSR